MGACSPRFPRRPVVPPAYNASDSVFSAQTYVSKTVESQHTLLPRISPLFVGQHATSGTIPAGDAVYYAVDVPALLDNLVIEAHSCHGDVDIVATQVSLPVPLETRSFPTVTRYSWQRYVAFPDAWPAVLHPLTQCCSSQARGTPDSITIAAPVGRVIVGVIGVGTWGG